MYKKIAIFPGSFNPVHLGHISVIKKANTLFDKVYIVIANNESKIYNNDLKTRKIILINELKKHSIFNEIIVTNGLIPELAKKINATYIIRGIRNKIDFEYEVNLATKYKKLNSNLEIIYLFSDLNLVHYSSTKN